MSQLRHPNTITLYDYGQTEDGLIYMVMELLEGIALSDNVQESGALDYPRAAHVFIQVLKSLSEAHQRGLVHRDLKPENIFLCELFGEQDYVKVLDFGVAKMTIADEVEIDQKLTKAGRIFGTPMYMAPEQACAEPITPATDVYALGLLYFEMITGLPPVTGRNRMDVIHKQIRDPVPELTKELEGTAFGDFIRKATEKKPSARYHDASEMLEGFARALRAMNVTPRPKGQTRPEISISSLVPELPFIEEEPSETTMDDAETRVQKSLKERLRKPTPPPIPKFDSDAKVSVGLPTAERKALTSRLVSQERQKANEFAERPHSRPRYELPLIGREKDVLRLTDLVQDHAFNKSGAITLIEGENGIGKSRLINSLRSNLRNLGVDFCVGYCRRSSVPLEAVREAIADFWGVGHSERVQVDSVIRQDLEASGFTNDLDFIIDFVRPDPDKPDPSADELGARFAQLERVLVHLANRKPLVITIEDIQYADSVTLEFLEYIAVTLRTQQVPIFVLLSLRPEERALNHGLETSLRTISSNVGDRFARHVLRRLSGRDLVVLLDSILPLEQRLKERIGWLSQGVPLHAIQIVRYLQNENELKKVGEKWSVRAGSPREINLPPDLMDLMRLRIDQAIKGGDQSSLKATLEWLATLGMRTPTELLATVIGDSKSLDEDLERLREQGIVHQNVHRNLICVEFDNSLLREAILRDLGERWASRRLHKTAAEAKLTFYHAKNMQVPLIEIADHWRQAGESEKYRDTILASAQRAMTRQDIRGARERFRELVDLLEADGYYEETWVSAQIALGELAWRFGEFGLAEDHYRRAVEEGKGEQKDLGRALRGLGHLLTMQSRRKEALECYERALNWSDDRKDGPSTAKALVGMSRVHLRAGDMRANDSVVQRLQTMLPTLPNGEISGKVFLHLGEVSHRMGKLNERYSYLMKARHQFEDARDRQGLSDVLLSLGGALTDPANNAPDRYVEARKVLRQALELKQQLGDRFGVAEAYRYSGQLEIQFNNLDQADHLLHQALTLHQALGIPFNIAATFMAMGVSRLFRGDWANAQANLDQSQEIFQRIGDELAASHVLMNMGELAINQGDINRAQTLLREARRTKESIGSDWAVFDIRNHLAICAMWLGEFDSAESLLEETLRVVDEKGTGEDRAIARSLNGLLRCFQSRLQLAALELGRSRADAEDLGIDRVTHFCQANAAFYASLTESDATYQQLVNSTKNESFFYTLHQSVWMELLERLAMQTADNEPNRQSVRLLHTAARFAQDFGNGERYNKLMSKAKELDRKLRDSR